ncbi:MAG UNVERIFIED_CONTAM: integrase core domain-containing protein [Rickettsiaceae bacterium]|jgi:hypothetical protein
MLGILTQQSTKSKTKEFWCTINDNLLDCHGFRILAELEGELFKYMIYYNKIRPHQALNGKRSL